MSARALLLIALALAAAPAAGQSARAKRAELREVQRQLELKKRESVEYARQLDEIQRDVAKLAGETTESRRRVRVLEDKIRGAESRQGELKNRLKALHLAEDQWREVVTDEVRAWQDRLAGRSDWYGLGGLWEETFRRAAILEKLRYVSELHGVRRETQALEAETLRRARELEAKSERLRAEHQVRESLYRRKKETYDETQQKLAGLRQAVVELQDSALALTHLLRALERKSAYKARGGDILPAEARHSLPWPTEGRVVGGFGRERVPELKTVVVRQGIRVATPAGAPVRPVKPGKVIFAGPFRSYGLVLIVDHGAAFYTIYGQLGELRKRKGDAVQADDVLATAGPPRIAGEPQPIEAGGTLYFEMRQSGDAVDPLDWLRR